MNPDVKNLIELQEMDLEVTKLRAELVRYDKSRESCFVELKRFDEKVEILKVEILQVQKKVREDDRQMALWRDSLGKFLAQQSQVKTQREYDTLTHEMSETEEKISKIEEEGLAYLEEEEKLETRYEALEKELAERREESDIEIARITERQADRKKLIESIAEHREEIRALLDPEHYHRYERLQEQVPGTAIVPVQDGNCGGCFMRLIAHRIQVSGRGEGELVKCTSCHRFLYTPETDLGK